MVPGGLTPDTHTATEVARLLRLEPLDQEGGYFRRIAEANASGPARERAWSTIYFLVTPDAFSALHRLRADEIWCFHSCDAVESLRLYPDGRGEWIRLGPNTGAGQRLQDVIFAGTWQGTRLVAGGRWALLTCVVVPGFAWDAFELGDRDVLSARYVALTQDIAALSRPNRAKGMR